MTRNDLPGGGDQRGDSNPHAPFPTIVQLRVCREGRIEKMRRCICGKKGCIIIHRSHPEQYRNLGLSPKYRQFCLYSLFMERKSFQIISFWFSSVLLANVIEGVDADRNWLSNWCIDSYQAVEGELCLVRTQHGAKVVLARIKSIFGPDHHMSFADLSQGMFLLIDFAICQNQQQYFIYGPRHSIHINFI